jgi:hypothetical protein
MRKKDLNEEKSFNNLCREIVLAVRADEKDVDAAAEAPFAYQRIRARIASERQRGKRPALTAAALSAGLGRIFELIAGTILRRRSLVAAAAIAVIGIPASLWFRSTDRILLPPVTEPVAANLPPPILPAPVKVAVERQTTAEGEESPGPQAGRARAATRSIRRSEAGEIATDFLPLTYLANSDALESGHVMRVQVSRMALASLGVPMNTDRANEMVNADIVIGDDGLAHAIRIIQ